MISATATTAPIAIPAIAGVDTFFAVGIGAGDGAGVRNGAVVRNGFDNGLAVAVAIGGVVTGDPMSSIALQPGSSDPTMPWEYVA